VPITVLLLAANPLDTAPLRLDEELRHITRSIRAAEYRDAIRIVPWFAARPDDLVQGLLEHRPQVVHFSGHGSPAGEICFIGDDGRSRPASPEALHRVFGVLHDDVRVVILNACHSAAQAAVITTHVDVTIGMSRAIGDRAAIAFAGAFYRALGFGRSIQDAFELGVATLLLEGIPGEDIPQLITRAGAASAHHLLRDNDNDSGDGDGDRSPATPRSWVQNITSAAPGAIAQGAMFGNVINHPTAEHRSPPPPAPDRPERDDQPGS
jgi:hypothetical protein